MSWNFDIFGKHLQPETIERSFLGDSRLSLFFFLINPALAATSAV